ncbi:hypothetical protein ACS0TY_004482 [Phlomoides rotata]
MNECATFFFQNFPESCDWKVLHKSFNAVEKVRDIYISKRVDKVGRRFGFVRFGSHVNRVVVQKELNDIWFGSYKLRANVARFNRSREGKDHSNQQKEATPPSYIPPCGYGDRSFVEVVSGGIRDSWLSKSVSPQYNQNMGGMSYESSEEDRRYLKQSFLGFLKEDFLWIDIGSKIQEKGEGLVAVKYLGGSLVLLHPIKPEMIKIEDLECFTTWFDSFKQWSDDIVDYNRIIWTNWFGVPMHAWNTKFFNQFSCHLGQLIKIDEDTRLKRKLQIARILIRTPYHELPRTPIAVTIDGKIFHIRVREEGEDLEEDSEDRSSEDVTDDDGESDYDLEEAESDTDDSSTKVLEVSDGNPIGGRIDKPMIHPGEISNIATTLLAEHGPVALTAQNTMILSTTPKEDRTCALAPSIMEEMVEPSLFYLKDLVVGAPNMSVGPFVVATHVSVGGQEV